MSTDSRKPPGVHIFLLGVARTPIGGYKVAYEYANALAIIGVPVTVWHSESIMAFRGGRRRVLPALRSVLAWWLRGQRAQWQASHVSWFDFDERVRVKATGWLPRVPLAKNDALLATAVQSMPFVAKLAAAQGNRTAVLIQHFETWADSPEVIAAGWASMDERIVIAPWLAEKCAEFGLDSHLLPNALVADSFPVGPPVVERPMKVLSLLSPHGYKRPDVVIGALERILAKRPDTDVWAFGPVQDRPEMDPRIHYVPDPSPQALREMYQTSRVYLCGSDEEGWHLPPAEATLSGAAVVSTDIGGVRASMAEDALYSPRGDSEALAAHALEVLDTPDAAQRRIDRARARLLETTYLKNASTLKSILGV